MKFISVVFALILVGCGSSPSPVLPPVELTALENSINLSRVWKFTVGQGISDFYLKLKPAVHNNTGYISDYKGNLQAFNVNTGKVLWEKELAVPVSGGLTYANENIYLATSKGEVIALKASDASEQWRTQLSSEILSSPAVSKGVLVTKTIDGRVYGLDMYNGHKTWVYDRSVPRLTLRGSSSPIISNDVVITASDNGKLSALSLKQGKLLWETTISIAQGRNQLERVIDMDIDPIIIDDVIYIAGYQGRIAAVKLGSGQILWSREFSTYSGLYVDAFRVYITDAGGYVWALNRYNGSTLWRQDKLLRRRLTAPQTHDGYVVVGDYDGYLHWLNLDDGKIIARKRVNGSDIIIEDEERDPELELLFSKSNNILIRPIVIKDLLVSLDRTGHLEAFKIEKK